VKNIILDFMMGMICVLLVLSIFGILALPCVLKIWSTMRMNETWKENKEDEDDF
jgi:hypothetical protein